MSRPLVVAIVVLACLLVGAAIALAVIASRLAEKQNNGGSPEQVQGLPDFNTCDDIAVIGAGISGSNAAWRMRERNLSISLYEYSDRIGGRCYTVKLQGIPDVNVEMGAMRFKPHEHTMLNQTITELGLDIVDFVLGYGGGGNSLYYLRGKHMTYEELPTKAPYDIPDHARVDFDTFLWHLFSNFTKPEAGVTDDLTPENKQKIKTIDDRYLASISRRTYDALYLDTEITEYYADANAFRSESTGLSAIAWLPTSDPNADTGTASDPSPVKTVKQGFQAIPETMVQQFLSASKRHNFFRNNHLKSVRKHTNGRYILTFQPTETKAGITTEITSGKPVLKCSKKVVLAVSRLALKHIDWDGFKQPNIKDMLENSVQDVVAGKMYFGYDSRWWGNTTLGGKHPHAVSTTPLRQTYDFAVSPTGKAVLNPSYTDYNVPFWRDVQHSGSMLPSTDDGNQQIAMSNTSVFLARKFYAEVFNLTLDKVPTPNSAVLRLWDEYPFGAAWYDWSPGYRWSDVETAMMKPSLTDDVFVTSNIFSADQFSDWTEGGLRMVDKLLKKYLKT